MITFNDLLPILNLLYKMNSHRVDKCRALFELAQQADDIIVELGTYRGMSALALDAGSGHKVYTVDNWHHTGWAGEQYTAQDSRIAFDIISTYAGNVQIINDDISDLARGWPYYYEDALLYSAEDKDKRDESPISLLFWDTGVKNCLVHHFRLWSRHIKKGGLFLVHDTNDYQLGWKQLGIIAGNKWQVEEYPPLHGLRKL